MAQTRWAIWCWVLVMTEIHTYYNPKNALTTLTRAAQRDEKQKKQLEEALTGRLKRLAPIALQVAQETGDPIGSVLAKVLNTSANPSLAYRLHDQIPTETVALREVAVEVTQQCLEDQRHRGENVSTSELARLSNTLGNRLSDLGRREEALAAAEEAGALYRTLAEARPEAFPALPGPVPHQPGRQP